MIVTLCQQIFFPALNKCFWMRSITTFSGLHMELKHKKSGQYPIFAKFALIQMITVSKRPPHTTHTTCHTPHQNPHPHPAVHSSAARTYYSPAPPYRPPQVRAWSCQPLQLQMKKFCQYISKNKICVNYN